MLEHLKASCARSTVSAAARARARARPIGNESFTVPWYLRPVARRSHVQMFVTINAKHTRLNASHLVRSPAQLYRDDNPRRSPRRRPGVERPRDFAALSADQAAWGRPRKGGAGAAGAGAEEAVLKRRVRYRRRSRRLHEESKRFFVNYLKQVAQVFGGPGTVEGTASARRRRFAPSFASRQT